MFGAARSTRARVGLMTQTVRYEDRLLPSWALEELGPGDRRRADQARLDGQLRVDWESRREFRGIGDTYAPGLFS